MKYQSRTTSITIIPIGEPLYSEQATEVKIMDESGGEYVEVIQSGRTDIGNIAISPEEWPMLKKAIDQLIKLCGELK